MTTTVDINPLPAATGTTSAAAVSIVSPPSPTGLARTASPPWTQIVRGAEPELPSLPSSLVKTENPPEAGGDGNAECKKTAAWNKKPITTTAPSLGSGAAESCATSVVMGAELWPALSESTKASPKVSSMGDGSKNLPDFGSALSPQVPGAESLSTVSLSVRSPSSASQKSSSHLNNHPNSSHGRPARQRSMRRDGNGGNALANGISSHQPSQSISEGSHYNHNLNSPKLSPVGASESSGRDHLQNHSHRESGQRNASGDYSHQRNSFRRGNGGPHPRGDGSHHGTRADQDRGNHDWSNQRSFNGRDPSMQSRGVSRSSARPSPISTPFVHHPPVMPFFGPMMPDMPPILYLPTGMPFVAPVPHMYYPAPDPDLYSEIVKQINYYFSNENLVKDTFLRGKMDANGWVHVSVIADFNKVKSLTTDPYRILDAVKASTIVEAQGDKIRRRDDWKRWIIPSSVQLPTVSGSQTVKVPADSALSVQIQTVALDEKTIDLNNAKGQVDVRTSTMLQSQAESFSSLSLASKNHTDSSGY